MSEVERARRQFQEAWGEVRGAVSRETGRSPDRRNRMVPVLAVAAALGLGVALALKTRRRKRDLLA